MRIIIRVVVQLLSPLGGRGQTVQTPINLRFRMFMFCVMSPSMGFVLSFESLHVCNVRSPLLVPISRHVSLRQPRAKKNLHRLMAETLHVQHDAAAAMTILVSSISAHNMQTVVVTPAAIILATNDFNLLWALGNGRERMRKRKNAGIVFVWREIENWHMIFNQTLQTCNL